MKLTGWFCDIVGNLAFASAEFAAVCLDRGEEHWTTSRARIDHFAELHHSMQAARFLDPIRGLENSASSSQQRRILDDLQTVAQALFTDFASFRDIGFGKAQEAPDAKEDACPSRRSRRAHPEPGGNAGTWSRGKRPGGSYRITGILRLLFETEQAAADTAADDEKLDEGEIPEEEPKKGPEKEPPKDEVPKPESVNAKLQAKLAVQMEAFLANLSKPEFAENCSATQMIQAVCFPLAVALRRAAPWLGKQRFGGDLGAQGGCCSLPWQDSKLTRLASFCRRRYSERGLSNIFREIVGDGTLWMVLIATLGSSEWREAGSFIERAIALRQVFKGSALISSAQAPRLVSLSAASGSMMHATMYLLSRRKYRTCSIALRTSWDLFGSARRACRLRDGLHIRSGDSMWRANVGWAVCIAEATGRDSILVMRGSEKVKIGASFFVNVSELATRHPRLSKLFADLRERLAALAPADFESFAV